MERDISMQEIRTTGSQLAADGSGNSGIKADKGHEEQQSTKTVPYYKLFSFADSVDYAVMVVGVIAAAGSGLAIPLTTVIFGKLVNAFGRTLDIKQLTHEVSKVSVDFVYLAVGSFIACCLQVTCWMVTGQRQASRIRRLYLKTILRQDICFFDTQTSTGEIIGRMSGDTVIIQDALGEKVGQFIQCLVAFVGGFVLAFIKGWLLTLVLLSSIPTLVIAGAVMSIVIAKVTNRGQDAYSKAATAVDQTFGSIRTVASFTGEKLAITKYKQTLEKSYRAGVQEGLASRMGLGVMYFIVFSTYSLSTWYGGKMVLDKGYTGGDVVTVVVAIILGCMNLGQASPCMSAFAAGQAAAYKMFETIERKPIIDAYDMKGEKLDEIRGNIELKEVYFSYPARPDEQIFSGLSLSIPSGATVALVGQTGNGKSTVLSLIERFYDPQAGEVLIDGINLKEIQLKWIRQKIGLVSQEPVLFTCSIRDNIAIGKEGATLEEIKTSVELANAAKFVDKLPEGLNTMVGENGIQLSGGQKQRIAIARAILKDPRILLLDEATSALDAESERFVQEALNKIMINRTTVIVAHRLSTIRHADMIAVIHQGKVVEKGSDIELTRNPNGVYSELIRLQQITTAVEEGDTIDNDNLEITHDPGRHSNQPSSLLRSISSKSSAKENNNHLSVISEYSTVDPTEKADANPGTSKEASRKPHQSTPLHRLASLSKPEIPVLIMATLAATANGAVLPVFGLLLSSMLKTLFERNDELRDDSKFWAKIFLVLALASLVTYPLRTYLFAVAGCRLIQRIRSMCFEKIIYMETSWFDEPENSTGAIGARLSTDAASVRALAGDALGLLVQNIASSIVASVIAFSASWQLSFIVLVLLPLIGVSGYAQLRVIKGFSANAKKLYEEATQVVSDAVGSIRTVASFCAEEKMLYLYHKKCEGPIKTGTKQGLVSGVGFGLSNFLMFAVYALCFYAGARLVQDGKTTVSDVFRVFLVLAMGAIGISQSSSFVPDASKAKTSAASIISILDKKSKIDSSNETGTTLELVKGEIQFNHVSFKYPARPNIQILRNLCLDIPFGKTIAIVGESGSGKSTVISLLQRFYDPDSGHITLDGVEIQKLQLKWLRHQMGLVSQEPVLFNDTIRANIAYGKEGNATEAEIVEAVELANAQTFISALQNGYDTIVGERGVQLSGGQKQRVAIARAIVKNPKILLLDEATSALDAESEKVVQDALSKVMVKRTTIVVAHRLSTIKGVDLIAVVSNGVIAEKGKHETLINMKDGMYASLVASHTVASTTWHQVI